MIDINEAAIKAIQKKYGNDKLEVVIGFASGKVSWAIHVTPEGGSIYTAYYGTCLDSLLELVMEEFK